MIKDFIVRGKHSQMALSQLSCLSCSLCSPEMQDSKQDSFRIKNNVGDNAVCYYYEIHFAIAKLLIYILLINTLLKHTSMKYCKRVHKLNENKKF